MNTNPHALYSPDEFDPQTGSAIRLANLELLVCELLRKNQSLRDELSQLRLKDFFNQAQAEGEFNRPNYES